MATTIPQAKMDSLILTLDAAKCTKGRRDRADALDKAAAKMREAGLPDRHWLWEQLYDLRCADFSALCP